MPRANKDFCSRLAKSLYSQTFVMTHPQNGPNTRFFARPWKDELVNGNAVPELATSPTTPLSTPPQKKWQLQAGGLSCHRSLYALAHMLCHLPSM